MSSATNIQTEILVDVELVPVEVASASAVETSEPKEQSPQHSNRNQLNGGVVKSYQSTAATKTRTLSTNSDESVLLPDIGYSPVQSKSEWCTIIFELTIS